MAPIVIWLPGNCVTLAPPRYAAAEATRALEHLSHSSEV